MSKYELVRNIPQRKNIKKEIIQERNICARENTGLTVTVCVLLLLQPWIGYVKPGHGKL